MIFARIISSWMPVGVWAGLIYCLSDIPSLSTGWGTWDLLLRKGAHVVEFGILTLLLLRAFKRSWPDFLKSKLMAWSGIVACLYAISDEFHQSFVPGRGPSIQDVLVDSIGIAAVLFLVSKREALWARL